MAAFYGYSRFYFVLYLFFLQFLDASAVVDGNMVKEWAENLGTQLKDIAEIATKAELIKSEYGNMGFEDFDPEAELDRMAEKTSQYFRNKSDVAWAARDALESRQLKSGNDTLGLDNPASGKFFRYFNTKDDLSNRVIYNHAEDDFTAENYTEKLDVTPNANMFNLETNDVHSAVHVPTPIYPRRKEILAKIAWSNVDELYRREKEFSRDLGWQFFCSEAGFMRFFPARKWPYDIKDKELDLFDCRSTEWYIDGATNSKNVMIMLDYSGSMLGQRFEIAKQLIETLLETLSENDFFNIMLFNKNVTWLDECYAGEMIQATQRNKKLLRSKLGDHLAEGIAAYEYALTEAFNILLGLNVTANWTDAKGLKEGEIMDDLWIKMSSGRVWRLTDEYRDAVNEAHEKGSLGCNSAIMLITDGADDFYSKVFQECNKERKVRVFSFLVGREATDFTRVRHMACTNNGFFVHIQDLADVTEKVQHYIKVMSRPLGYRSKAPTDKTSQMIWTGAYYERLYTTEQQNARGYWIRAHDMDPKGLKMVTTVAYPVVTNGTFRGVAGVAVPMIEIKQMAPNFRLGTNAYSFLVDNNGYTMYHPQLRPMHGYRQKPNYNSMDILELEVLSNNKELLKYDDHSIERLVPENVPVDSCKVCKFGRCKKSSTKKLQHEHCYLKTKCIYPFQLNGTHFVYNVEGSNRTSIFLGAVTRARYPVRNSLMMKDFRLKLMMNSLAQIGTHFQLNHFQRHYAALLRIIYPHGHVISSTYDIDELPSLPSVLENKGPSISRTLDYNNELRKCLVDGISSKESRWKFNATVLVMVEDEKRVYIQKNMYYHRKLEGTLFSLGLAIPPESHYRIKTSIGNFKEVKDWFQGNNWRLHPDWRYCFVNNSDADVSPEKAMQIYAEQMSAIGMLPELCTKREDLVQRLLTDARISKIIDSEWSAKWRSDQKHGIHLVYLALTSGLTRFADMKLDSSIAYHDPTPIFEMNDADAPNATSQPTQKPYVAAPSYVHYITERKRGPEEIFYKRAMRFPNEELVFDVNLNNRVYHTDEYESAYGIKENISLLVTAARALFIDGKAPIGVIGFEMLYDSLATLVKDVSNGQCLTRARGLCYLLDENGYVIYTSKPIHYGNFTNTYGVQELGRHFGDLPEGGPQFYMMNQFKEQGIYHETLYVDFQALCIAQKAAVASAVNKILSPIYALIKLLHWLYNEVGLLFAEFGAIGAISKMMYPAEAFTVTFQSEAEGMPCDKAATFFIRNEQARQSNWEIKSKSQICDDRVGCKVGGYVSRVLNTNLLLVYVKPLVGDCLKRHANNVTCIKSMHLELMNSLTKGKKMTQYFEVFNGSDKDIPDSDCRLRSRYRRKPMTCYNMDSNETEKYYYPCAGAYSIGANSIALIISLASVLITILLLS